MVGTSLWIRHGGDLSLPFQLPGWLPPLATTIVRIAVLLALIGLLSWISVGILRLLWQPWVRAEQNAVLDHRPPGGNDFWPLTGMGMVVWIIVSLVFVVVRATPAELPELFLATIKRQIKVALDGRLGRDDEGRSWVEQVVVTKFTQFRADL